MSLRERILKYFKAKPGVFISSAEIERLTVKNTTYIASNAARRCRELHEEGHLARELRRSSPSNPKLIAWYCYQPNNTLEEKMEAYWNSI